MFGFFIALTWQPYYWHGRWHGGDWSHRQYSLRLPTEGWPGWVGLGGWLHTEVVCPHEDGHPSHY